MVHTDHNELVDLLELGGPGRVLGVPKNHAVVLVHWFVVGEIDLRMIQQSPCHLTGRNLLNTEPLLVPCKLMLDVTLLNTQLLVAPRTLMLDEF